MPSSILVLGKKKYKPGIYGNPDFSALGGKSVSKGIVAVVGEYPQLEAKAIYEFADAKTLRLLYPDDIRLQTIGKVAFEPAADDQVPFGAAKLILVNAQPVTQATRTIKDSAGNDALVLKSKVWGQKGNQVYYKLEANAADAKAIDGTLALPGMAAESFPNMQSGKVVELQYSGADLSTTNVTVGPATWTWNWTKALAVPGGAVNPNQIVFTPTTLVIKGALTVQLSAAPNANKTVTVTVKCITSTGVAKTLPLVFVAGQMGPSNLQDTGVDANLSDITEVTVAASEVGFDTTATLSAKAFDITTSAFTSVGAIVGMINNYNSRGFHAGDGTLAKTPKVGNIGADQIDKQTTVDVKSPAKATLRADLWAMVEALKSSAIVTASRATNADLAPKPWNLAGTKEEGLFLGGQESGTAAGDWTDALAELATEDVNHVVVDDDDIARAKALIVHCDDAAMFGYERNGYFGYVKDKTLQELFDEVTSKLNSRHVSACGQEIQIEDAIGAAVWKEPFFQALQLAGIQAGRVKGTSPTHKRPNVLAVRQKWTMLRDDDNMISKGILGYSQDELGIIVERAVTTWLEDDNAAKSEVHANESVNTSIRRVRATFKGKIGDSTSGLSVNQLKGMLEVELDKQVKDGDIKAWKDASVVDLGDAYKFIYKLAPDESLNFITVEPSVTRIAA